MSCCPTHITAVAGPVGVRGPQGVVGFTGSAFAFAGVPTVTQILPANVSNTPNVTLTLRSIPFTFPATGGPWRVQAAYNIMYLCTAASNPVACWVEESTTPSTFAGSQSHINSGLNGGNQAMAVSGATFPNGSTVTFLFRLTSGANLTVTVNPATPDTTAKTFFTLTAFPA